MSRSGPALLTVLAVVGACAGAPAPQAAVPAPSLTGQWEYRGSGRGPAVTLELRLVGSDSVTGHVLHWMSGDMGMSVDGLPAIDGHLAADGELRLRIPMAAPAPAIALEGHWAGDTVQVWRSTRGGDPGPLGRQPGSVFVRVEPAGG